jgi:lysozyme
MDMIRLMKSVKQHEGFRNSVYRDTLGKRTVGYGHLCVEDHWEDNRAYTVPELERVLEADLNNAVQGAESLFKDCPVLEDLAQELIVEMIFQLGKSGVSKFKNMWKALKHDPPNYEQASIEMLDSRWAKQTPARAKGMSEQMRSLA